MADRPPVLQSSNTRFLLGAVYCCISADLHHDSLLMNQQYTRYRPHFPAATQDCTADIAGYTNEERDEMTDTQVVWLTQESHDRLKAELDQLIANRPIIAAEINDRREEGDLRENGGYHAARDQQGQEEARIRQLQELLNSAKVGEAPKQKDVALPGSVVEVEFTYADGSTEKEKFLIATRQEGAGHEKLEVYSPNSPLGAALLHAKKDEVREYKVPSGKTVKVKLLKAEPYHA